MIFTVFFLGAACLMQKTVGGTPYLLLMFAVFLLLSVNVVDASALLMQPAGPRLQQVVLLVSSSCDQALPYRNVAHADLPPDRMSSYKQHLTAILTQNGT